MSIFETLYADLKKIFAFAPVAVAVAKVSDPQNAEAIDTAAAAVASLQTTVQAVHDAVGGNQTHEQLVDGVTKAVADSANALAKQGMLSSPDNQHVQQAASIINAAVAVSGLAVQTPAA